MLSNFETIGSFHNAPPFFRSPIVVITLWGQTGATSGDARAPREGGAPAPRGARWRPRARRAGARPIR
eukprot:792914-Pyramimonas_sp.AAC.1